MRRLLTYSTAVVAIGAALVFLGAVYAAAATAAVAPRTLVSVRGHISAFAQDGTQIAWINKRDYDTYLVQIRSLTNGRSAVFSIWFDPDLSFPPHRLALGGTRAVWVEVPCTMEETCYDVVTTGALGERSSANLDSLAHAWGGPPGEVVGPMAGDAGTLAYSTNEWAEDPPVYVGAVLWRVVGRAQTAVPSAPGAVVLAASSGRIAVVPGTPDTYDPTSSIELRDPVSGELLRIITAGGNVRALAFSGTMIAALVEKPTGGKMIERYDTSTGALLGSTWVSPGIAAELDMAGDRIVYRTGRAIRLMNAITGAKKLLLVASVRPIGLSIEGRRVAWAVNRNDGSAIKAIVLP